MKRIFCLTVSILFLSCFFAYSVTADLEDERDSYYSNNANSDSQLDNWDLNTEEQQNSAFDSTLEDGSQSTESERDQYYEKQKENTINGGMKSLESERDWYYGSGASSTEAGLDCSSGVCFPANTNLPDTDMQVIIANVLYWFLGIFGLLAIIAFVISGIQYILSAGSEEMIDTAKRNMKWSIVGVVVALSGLIIIYAIDAALRGSSAFF